MPVVCVSNTCPWGSRGYLEVFFRKWNSYSVWGVAGMMGTVWFFMYLGISPSVPKNAKASMAQLCRHCTLTKYLRSVGKSV